MVFFCAWTVFCLYLNEFWSDCQTFYMPMFSLLIPTSPYTTWPDLVTNFLTLPHPSSYPLTSSPLQRPLLPNFGWESHHHLMPLDDSRYPATYQTPWECRIDEISFFGNNVFASPAWTTEQRDMVMQAFPCRIELSFISQKLGAAPFAGVEWDTKYPLFSWKLVYLDHF